MSKKYSNLNVTFEKNHRSLFAFIVAALISTTAYDAQAAVFLWNNTGTQWTSTGSWVGGVQPAATGSSTTTDFIEFGSLAAGFNSVQLTSNRAAAGMTFCGFCFFVSPASEPGQGLASIDNHHFARQRAFH